MLYVTAHAVKAGLVEHAAMVTDQLRRDSLRKLPLYVAAPTGSSPSPDPVRRGLVDTTDRVIAAAGKAATLTPPEHLERVRATPRRSSYEPGPLPRRSVQQWKRGLRRIWTSAEHRGDARVPPVMRRGLV